MITVTLTKEQIECLLKKLPSQNSYGPLIELETRLRLELALEALEE